MIRVMQRWCGRECTTFQIQPDPVINRARKREVEAEEKREKV
jgi:hypothetical protein